MWGCIVQKSEVSALPRARGSDVPINAKPTKRHPWHASNREAVVAIISFWIQQVYCTEHHVASVDLLAGPSFTDHTSTNYEFQKSVKVYLLSVVFRGFGTTGPGTRILNIWY